MQVSEIQVSYLPKIKASDQPQITTSRDAFLIFLEHWNEHTIHLREEFKLLLLNRANRVLGLFPLSSGGTVCTVVDPRLVFAVALKTAASSIVVCHNHPSGSLKPSERDLTLSRRLKDGGQLLGIDVLDHLIICSDAYFSLLDEGLL
jgi:DNA repair protein RadC